MVAAIITQVRLLNTRCLLRTGVLRILSKRTEMSASVDDSKLQAGDGSDTGVTEPGKRPIEKVEGTDEGVESKKIKTSSDNQTTEGSSTQSQAPYKKKKVAMMLSYCGQGYSGMQRNPGMLTIESVLLNALVKAGVVRQEHADFPGEKMKFQRAARTDKGVSAAGQVCSLKISICRDSIESPPLS